MCAATALAHESREDSPRYVSILSTIAIIASWATSPKSGSRAPSNRRTTRSTWGRSRSWSEVAADGSPRRTAARSSLSSNAEAGPAATRLELGGGLGTSHSLAACGSRLVVIPASGYRGSPKIRHPSEAKANAHLRDEANRRDGGHPDLPHVDVCGRQEVFDADPRHGGHVGREEPGDVGNRVDARQPARLADRARVVGVE